VRKAINPFSDPNITGWNAVATARIAATLEFLEANRPQIIGRVLDIGGDSPMSRAIASRFPVELVHTPPDLDLDLHSLDGEWDQIFSFEVIEHLGSPLRHLLEMKAHLKPGGSIWLSTPLVVNRLRPTHAFRSKHHVFEMDWVQLDFLIEKANLRVTRYKICRYLPVWKYFTGIRPVIRFFTDRCILLQLSAS
jgi:SAM-dependent methyltransferase